MPPRLPNATAKELARALENAGFVVQRPKGSHATFRHPDTKRTTVVLPLHSGDVKRPFLKMILMQAGLTEEDFSKLL